MCNVRIYIYKFELGYFERAEDEQGAAAAEFTLMFMSLHWPSPIVFELLETADRRGGETVDRRRWNQELKSSPSSMEITLPAMNFSIDPKVKVTVMSSEMFAMVEGRGLDSERRR